MKTLTVAAISASVTAIAIDPAQLTIILAAIISILNIILELVKELKKDGEEKEVSG